jgi:hypothetical protein
LNKNQVPVLNKSVIISFIKMREPFVKLVAKQNEVYLTTGLDFRKNFVNLDIEHPIFKVAIWQRY